MPDEEEVSISPASVFACDLVTQVRRTVRGCCQPHVASYLTVEDRCAWGWTECLIRKPHHRPHPKGTAGRRQGRCT